MDNHREPHSLVRKKDQILGIIKANLFGSDLKWNLFVSAVISRKPEICKPTPNPEFIDQLHKEPDIEKLLSTIAEIPAFPDLIKNQHLASELAINLLYWILVELKPSVKLVPPELWSPFLKEALQKRQTSQPLRIFEISRETSSSNTPFDLYKEQFGSRWAFHGSRLECFHSILNYGLAQHLCKRDLYGEGLYLSTDLDVSLIFSQMGLGWDLSFLPKSLSCVALCEFVPHPQFVNRQKKSVPDQYIVIHNNDLVKVRYLLIYGKPRRKQGAQPFRYLPKIVVRHKAIFSVILYVCILLFIGLNSENIHLIQKISNFWRFLVSTPKSK